MPARVLRDSALSGRDGCAGAGDLTPEPDMLGSQPGGGCGVLRGSARFQQGGEVSGGDMAGLGAGPAGPGDPVRGWFPGDRFGDAVPGEAGLGLLAQEDAQRVWRAGAEVAAVVTGSSSSTCSRLPSAALAGLGCGPASTSRYPYGGRPPR